jgi:putative transposase
VWVLAPRAQRPCKPWVTVFLDAYSRLVMGWAVSLYPSSAHVWVCSSDLAPPVSLVLI